MRKSKAILVTLALLLLVPSLLMASPSTWGWLQSNQPSESLELPAETLPEEQPKLTPDSPSSKATSKAKVEYVTVPKDVFEAALGEIEEGNASNKKGGEAVEAARQSLQDSAVATKYAPKLQYFGVMEGGWNPDAFELGVGLGFIFKDALIGKIGVEKKNILDMSDWLDWKNAYKVTASVGIIF